MMGRGWPPRIGPCEGKAAWPRPALALGEGDSLGEHAGGDEVFAAGAVGQPASEGLSEAPDGRVEGGEYADAGEGKSVGGVQEREDSPGEGIVEVVDHAGLAGRGQAAFP